MQALAEDRADYGFDAPYAIVIFGCLALLSAFVGTWNGLQGSRRMAVVMAIYFVFFALNVAGFLYGRRGSSWSGDGSSIASASAATSACSTGCGRGAVLTAVARRLTTGHVTGVDIWSTHDQSGTARDVTVHNASLERRPRRGRPDR
jgi:hypothetical protein